MYFIVFISISLLNKLASHLIRAWWWKVGKSLLNQLIYLPNSFYINDSFFTQPIYI